MKDGQRNRGGFFFGFLVGAAIGGAAAVLLLQEDTREMLLGKAKEASDRAMGATQDIRGKVNDVTSTWQASANDVYNRGRQVVDDARSTVGAAVEEGKNAANQTRDDLQRQNET